MSAASRLLLRLLPSSIGGLMVLGSLVAALPLLLALMLANASLDRVAKLGERAVAEAIEATQLALALRDALADLERNARQFEVLRSVEMIEVMAGRVDHVAALVARMQRRPMSESARAALGRIARDIAIAEDRALLADPRQPPLASAQARELVAAAEHIIDEGQRSLGHQTEALREAAEQARRVVALSGLGLAPLALALGLAAAAWIAAPVRRIGRALAAIGEGDYSVRVDVRFPREAAELAARLNWLAERLAQFEQDKDRFLRSVSHELKTPLASLREGSELLQREVLGPLNPQQQGVAAILAESSRIWRV